MNHNQPSINIGRPQYASALQAPFYNANNIFMFYGGGKRGQITENVIQAVRGREPVVHVHGEPGSGKTMMALVISDRIKRHFHTVRYDTPGITAAKLMRQLLIKLTPQYSDMISAEQAQEGAGWSVIETAIDQFKKVLSQNTYSKSYVFFIDSNDSLDADSLRLIEQLSCVEADSNVVIHCIVFHRTENDVGHYASVSDTPQRASNHYWLQRLTYGEISDYLRHHMMLFDFSRRDLFNQEMAFLIAERSGGVFRSVNTLARNAFALANLDEKESLLTPPVPLLNERVSEEVMMQKSSTKRITRPYGHYAVIYTFLGFGAMMCTTAIMFLIR